MTVQSREKWIDTDTVSELTGGIIKSSTLRWWRHKNDGTGPPSYSLGPRKVAYKESEVLAWLEGLGGAK